MVDTSAKTEDKAEAGVEQLEALMMELAFMKAEKKPRPNWGDLNDEDEAPKAAPKSTGGPAVAKTADLGVEGPKVRKDKGDKKADKKPPPKEPPAKKAPPRSTR